MCLQALYAGRDDDDATHGALLVMEHHADVKAIRTMMEDYFIAMAKASRRRPR